MSATPPRERCQSFTAPGNNSLGSAVSPGESAETNLNTRIASAIGATELNDRPLVAIAASPCRRLEVTGLFEGRDNAMVRLLENPPELRPHGFDVTVGTESRIIRAQLRRSVIPGARLLELWRDGTLIFVGTADSLCWGMSNRPGQPLRINPLALVEMNYLFVDLYFQIVTHILPEEERMAYLYSRSPEGWEVTEPERTNFLFLEAAEKVLFPAPRERVRVKVLFPAPRERVRV